MPDGTYDAALEAFQSGLAESENQPVEPSGEVEPSQAEPVTQETPSRGIDISGLPEEAQIYIRAREREMQADYTRKTQEAAEQRRQAEQAIQFIEALNSDPNFAYQAYQQLQAQLAQQGYIQPDYGVEEDAYDEYGNVIDEGPDPYQQEIAELAWRQQQMENQWVEASLSAQIDRQLATIQNQHPDWDEGDIQSVIDYGFATGGDLFKAADLYQGQVDRALARYLEKKGSVNTPSPLPNAPASQPAHQPQTEKEVAAAAKEYVMRQLSG